MGRPANAGPSPSSPHIAIVGPCGAGKTTLAEGLRAAGYRAHQIAPEHSYVPEMWARITQPDVLIYLEASFEACTQRKQLDWLPREYDQQLRRLAHARTHCDLKIPTDDLTPDEILARALRFLESFQT